MATQLKQDEPDQEPNKIKSWRLLNEIYEIPEKRHPLDKDYQQAQDISRDIESELEPREDLRDLPTVTIDPDYAHDHDDAVSIIEDDEGYRAFVHIADVEHYVPEGSPIDEEAKERTRTFYLGNNTRHMIPRKLAQDICSLAPGADRLAHTVEMQMNREGEVQDFDVYKSVIESNMHLTETHSNAIIENFDEIDQRYDEMDLEHEEAEEFYEIIRAVDNLDEVSDNIREERWDSSLILNQRDSSASKIIEEMMVQANLAVGDYLSDEVGKGIYRTEQVPEKGWAADVVEGLSDLGYDKPAGIEENPVKALNNFFEEKVSEDEFEEARDQVIPNIPPAGYESGGDFELAHFGLGSLNYAHFTSPIRRVVDLVNHRLIAGTFEGTDRDLERLAERSTDIEDEAEDAAEDWHDAHT